MVKKYTRRRHLHRGKKSNGLTLRSRKQRGGYKHIKTPGEQLISSPRKTKTKSKTKTRRSKSSKNFKWF